MERIGADTDRKKNCRKGEKTAESSDLNRNHTRQGGKLEAVPCGDWDWQRPASPISSHDVNFTGSRSGGGFCPENHLWETTIQARCRIFRLSDHWKGERNLESISKYDSAGGEEKKHLQLKAERADTREAAATD